MTVRVIKFKKRRVNRFNKSILKKKPSSHRKKEGFFGIKRKSVCFSNKTSSLHTSLTGSLHKVSRSTCSLIPDIFFPVYRFSWWTVSWKRKIFIFSFRAHGRLTSTPSPPTGGKIFRTRFPQSDFFISYRLSMEGVILVNI